MSKEMPSFAEEMKGLDQVAAEEAERLRKEQRETDEAFDEWLKTATEPDLKAALKDYENSEVAYRESLNRSHIDRDTETAIRPNRAKWNNEVGSERTQRRLALIRGRLGTSS
jgi:hypothetical protein